MSRKCDISGKGAHKGNTVSKANNKRRKTWNANLHKRRLFNAETGEWVTLKVSSRMLRTIDKKGLAAALRENQIQ